MTRIVVIGGSGFLGSRAVGALAAAPGVEVVSAGRRGPLVVDLARPETFAALSGADVVVDVSSSHAAPPDALASWALEHGVVLLEASSDRVVIERLLDAHRDRSDVTGALVLGAGLFTGVSNAMAGEVARTLPGAESIELVVVTSPFSGAGEGTVDLMVDALAATTRTIRGGRRVDDPPVAAGPDLALSGGATRTKTLHVPFAEPVMIHASTRATDVAMYMAPRPALLRAVFLALPALALRNRAFLGLLRLWLGVVRRIFLRSVPTWVELHASARRGSASAAIKVRAGDGMDAAGVAIAATALALARRRPKGTYVVDELVPLDEMLAGMRTLSPCISLAVSRR